MAQLAIKGHSTKGPKVIEILRSLGGINILNCAGLNEESFYYIGKSGMICYCTMPHNRMVFTLEEFLERFPYKVGDKVQHKGATSCGTVYVIEHMNWVNTNIEYEIRPLYDYNHTGLVTIYAEDLQPYKETMEDRHLNPKANSIAEKIKQETKKVKEFFESKMNLTIQDIRDNNAEWLLNKLQAMSAEGALQTISDLYDELHKPQYPKTYDECCTIMGFNSNTLKWDNFFSINKDTYPYIKHFDNLIESFCKLLVCRDAYRKIAEEQMGLDKPLGQCVTKYKYGIRRAGDTIITSYSVSCVLAFPTMEMRDAFYENFKELINETKELL